MESILTADILANTGIGGAIFYNSIPREYYVSAEIFEQEYDRIFARQWMMVGHECQVPRPGDYFTVDIAGENIIITRTQAGHLQRCTTFVVIADHAYAMRPKAMCRCSSVRTIRGHMRPTVSLRMHLRFPDGEYINYGEYGLKTVHIDSSSGFIFIHLAEEKPSSLAGAFAQMNNELPAIPADGIKLVYEVTHDLKANWKLLAENNLECYHCPFCHDMLCSAADVDSFKADLATAARYAVTDHNFVGGIGPGIPARPGAIINTVRQVCQQAPAGRSRRIHRVGVRRGLAHRTRIRRGHFLRRLHCNTVQLPDLGQSHQAEDTMVRAR